MAPNITDCVLKPALINTKPLIVKEPLSSQKQCIEHDVNNNKKPIEKSTKQNRYFEQDLVWRNIIIIGYSYFCLVYGFYLLMYTKWISFIWREYRTPLMFCKEKVHIDEFKLLFSMGIWFCKCFWYYRWCSSVMGS